ncbi:MAG: urea ABC transporter permease subunit UrtB [Anaeromyxobacter sp.]
MPLLPLLCAAALGAPAPLDPAAVAGLAAEATEEKLEAIRALAQAGDPRAGPVLQALVDGRLQAGGGQVLVEQDGALRDASSGAAVATPPAGAAQVVAPNRVRRAAAAALSTLRAFDPDPAVRLAAARDLARAAGPEQAPLLRRAIAQEQDGRVAAQLKVALGRASLRSADPAERRAAAEALGEASAADARTLLAQASDPATEADPTVRAAAAGALVRVDRRLAIGEAVNQLFSGLSLGSVLLLAALGLAITYGVMGVINMAHGELLMVGAYSAYAVQAAFRAWLPGLEGLYVLAAMPVAFGAAFLAGVVMERLVIRHLYRRPLESLLATFGLSLVMIQGARGLFGAQNVQVANPGWMSGAAEPWGNVVLPWNRLAVIAFALGVLLVTWLLLSRTRLGLQVRAVTQNRAMAGCLGVPTGRVDTLAFGLGAGIAGLGGLALSQLGNVGPDMGQGYIVDSFVVVVLGGVGQLAGAVVAALGLGAASKLLEGWSGAVIAKILVLVFVVVFIQKRPQGLFAPRGRFVQEA